MVITVIGVVLVLFLIVGMILLAMAKVIGQIGDFTHTPLTDEEREDIQKHTRSFYD